MNSADMPPAVVPAASQADRADGAEGTLAAELAGTAAPPQDPAAPAGPPGSVTGPAAPPAARGLALRVPAWSASTRISVNNDPERIGISPGYHVLHRPWQPGDVVTLDGISQTIEVTAAGRLLPPAGPGPAAAGGPGQQRRP